jgi:hypothetical protein
MLSGGPPRATFTPPVILILSPTQGSVCAVTRKRAVTVSLPCAERYLGSLVGQLAQVRGGSRPRMRREGLVQAGVRRSTIRKLRAMRRPCRVRPKPLRLLRSDGKSPLAAGAPLARVLDRASFRSRSACSFSRPASRTQRSSLLSPASNRLPSGLRTNRARTTCSSRFCSC